MKNFLNFAPVERPKFSTFNLGYVNKLTAPFGKIVPVFCQEMLPNDTFKYSSDVLVRIMPMLAPIFQNVRMTAYSFFVPNRILWKNWEKFIVKQGDAVQSDTPVHPYFTIKNILTLWDDAKVAVTQNSVFRIVKLAAKAYVDNSNSTPQNYKNPSYYNHIKYIFRRMELFFGDGSLFDYLGFPSPMETTLYGIWDNIRSLAFAHETISSSTDLTDDEWNSLYASLSRFFAAFGFAGFENVANYNANGGQMKLNALPVLGYNFIWNDFFRDENLFSSIADDEEWPDLVPSDGNCSNLLANEGTLSVGTSTSRVTAMLLLKPKAWQRDYFTSCLPNPLKGEAVNIPVSVSGGDVSFNFGGYGDSSAAGLSGNGGVPGGNGVSGDGSNVFSIGKSGSDYPYTSVYLNQSDTVVDGTIEQLRVASTLQRLRELIARGGHRYKEMIQNFFGAHVPDNRLSRPEFLGSSIIPMQIDEILQTSQTTEDAPLGDYAGHGRMNGRNKVIRYHSDEHGFFFSFIAIVPTTSYQQGLKRQMCRMSPNDYFIPQFQSLGEQAIPESEIFCKYGDDDDDNKTFGYLPRYSEYKQNYNEVHGLMRSSLSFWHMGRIFSSAPNLNGDFISVDQDSCTRVFATTYHENERRSMFEWANEDSVTISNKFYIMLTNHCIARRPMRGYAIPSLI